MKRWFLFVLKAGSVLATLGLLAIATYGHFSPWQVADDALPQFRGSPKLLVGFAYESQSIDGHTTERQSRTYVVLPTALQTLSTSARRRTPVKAITTAGTRLCAF